MGFDTPFFHPNNGRREREAQNPIEQFWGSIFGHNSFSRNDFGNPPRTQERYPHDLLAHQRQGHQLPTYEGTGYDPRLHHKHIKNGHELITKHPKHEASLPEVEIYHSEHRASGISTRDSLYHRQISSTTCEPTALAMAEAQFKTGHRPDDSRLQQLAQMTGTVGIGYRRGLEGVKHDAERLGMNAQVHSNSMSELDDALAQGRGAIIRVRNPHTGNPHYVYCFGKDSSGGYIIGDPDRFNNGARGHDRPVSRDALWNMMRHRDGFVSVSS